LRRSYWPLLAKAVLERMPFHSLRHSAASLLLLLGVHPKIVQELLGHSNISMTLEISHVIPATHVDVAR
jgi:site-specific recombinase XerD